MPHRTPLATIPNPKMLRVSGESDNKKLALGQSVRRALEVLGVTQQDAAGRMGYADQGTVSRWCSGLERPHFDKLLDIEGFEAAWFKVRSAQHTRMRLRTVIEIEEIA